MKTLFDYQRFILANYPVSRDWNKLRFAEWLAWLKDSGYIVTVLDDNQNIVALACAYPVMHEEQIGEVSDPEGSIIFVDIAVSLKKGGLQALGFAILKRFGMREKVAWRRPPYNVTCVYDAKRVRRNLFRAIRQLTSAEIPCISEVPAGISQPRAAALADFPELNLAAISSSPTRFETIPGRAKIN